MQEKSGDKSGDSDVIVAQVINILFNGVLD